jgi:hypothetical protein
LVGRQQLAGVWQSFGQETTKDIGFATFETFGLAAQVIWIEYDVVSFRQT